VYIHIEEFDEVLSAERFAIRLLVRERTGCRSF
jgi:hypothetical protein